MSDAVLLKPEDAAALLGISRTRVYGLIGSGELASVKIGRSRRVPRVELDSYVASIRAAATLPHGN